MSRGVNRVILVGNVGADPEMRYMQDGGAVATVSLATTETWGRSKHTEWHTLKFFDKLAETAEKYVRKGQKLYVEGKLRSNKYVTADNVEKFSIQIIVDNMNMLSGDQNLNES